MGCVTAEIELKAPVDEVWRFITNPENFARYVNGYQSGRTLSVNPVGVGATYEWYGKTGPIKVKAVEEVVAWEEGRRVAYSGNMMWSHFDSSMEVESVGARSTKLKVEIAYRPASIFGSRLFDRPLIEPYMRRHVQASLARLRKIF